MKKTKRIYCRLVRESDHAGLWDVLELRAGVPTGKVTYTGTPKEIRRILKAA